MAAKHHRGVDRIVAILEEVARVRHGRSLTDIARQLDAPLSSVQQLVGGLLAAGYLAEADRRYFLGPGVFALTMAVGWTTSAPVRHDQLIELAALTESRVALAVVSGPNMVYVDSVEDTPLWDLAPQQALRRPLLTSASGKILLAGMRDTELYATLRTLAEFAPQEQIDQFMGELSEIRASGLAWSYGASIPGLDAVATGVPQATGGYAAALVCSGVTATFRPRIADVGATLLDYVRRMSDEAN